MTFMFRGIQFDSILPSFYVDETSFIFLFNCRSTISLLIQWIFRVAFTSLDGSRDAPTAHVSLFLFFSFFFLFFLGGGRILLIFIFYFLSFFLFFFWLFDGRTVWFRSTPFTLFCFCLYNRLRESITVDVDYWVLPSFTGFYLVLLGFNLVLLGFT